MASKNDATGDEIQSKVTSESYRNNYDKIFGKKQGDTVDVKEEKEKEKLGA